MNRSLLPGLAATLSLTLAACGGSSENDFLPTHVDVPTTVITDSNALAIAADVYRVAAVDAPFTASAAMDPANPNAVNTAACTDPSAISSGDGGGMSGMGMDMIFRNCTLASSPSAHALTVDGRCTNSGTAAMEVVTGREIAFTSQGETLEMHNFTVTRASENMISAAGSLHRADGGIVNFATAGDFSGTAMVPTAGTLVIVGAASSRLRLTIASGGAGFTLEVDADGDGVYDDPQPPVEWNWNNDFWLPLIP